MASEMMVGDREAAGAIAGMIDLYGRPLPERGEAVRGVTAGKRGRGRAFTRTRSG